MCFTRLNLLILSCLEIMKSFHLQLIYKLLVDLPEIDVFQVQHVDNSINPTCLIILIISFKITFEIKNNLENLVHDLIE